MRHSKNRYFMVIVFLFLYLVVNINLAQNPLWYISHEFNESFDFNSINFIDSSTGWIAGQIFDSTPPNAIKSIVLMTSDGGKNWSEQVFDSLDNSSVWVEDIVFNREGVGLLTTFQGNYASINYGKSWYHLQYSDSLHVRTSCILNDSTWLVGGGFSSISKILKTKNFGLTWKTVFEDSLNGIKNIVKLDSSSIIATAAGSIVLSSFSAGDNWAIIGEFPDLNFKNIQAVNHKLIAVTEDKNTYLNSIYFSKDFGKSWQFIYSFKNSESIFCMHFADSLIGRAGGITENNVIYKTNNGGYTWEEEVLPITQTIWSIFNFKQTAFAGGSNIGKLLTFGIDPLNNISWNEVNSLSFKLNQNYPNPFNFSTTIEFELEKGAHVILTIFDINGREIATLLNTYKDKGQHRLNFNGNNLASGIYMYHLKTDKFSQIKKMLLIK